MMKWSPWLVVLVVACCTVSGCRSAAERAAEAGYAHRMWPDGFCSERPFDKFDEFDDGDPLIPSDGEQVGRCSREAAIAECGRPGVVDTKVFYEGQEGMVETRCSDVQIIRLTKAD